MSRANGRPAFTLIPPSADVRLRLRRAVGGPEGFTLIELLVVVTIIVVLLALLTPALDKAIYQTELTVCGSKLKSVGTGILTYTMSNKRWYPDRGLLPAGQTTFHPAPTALTDPTDNYDIRTNIRDYVSINKHLQCPMVQPLDLENLKSDENAGSSYTMWWGWRYQTTDKTAVKKNDAGVPTGTTTTAGVTERGMYKMGDKFTWQGEAFNVIAGDYDLWLGGGDANPVQGSHPDHDGLMTQYAFKYQSLFGAGAGDTQVLPITTSLWMRKGATDRGAIDMNHAFDDNSAARYNEVKTWWLGGNKLDKRMGLVPNQFDANQNYKFYQVPLR